MNKQGLLRLSILAVSVLAIWWTVSNLFVEARRTHDGDAVADSPQYRLYAEPEQTGVRETNVTNQETATETRHVVADQREHGDSLATDTAVTIPSDIVTEGADKSTPVLPERSHPPVQQPHQTVLAPEPYIHNVTSGTTTESSDTLTVPEILLYTNRARAAEGLPPLALVDTLSAAAREKVEDMFTRQYFEHKTPTGEDVTDFVKHHGYAYISVGENLAMGGFSDSEELVTGWMNSPGHRANILNASFDEIGIAVLRGEYQGDTVWMAVQIFGRPLSDCPAVDEGLARNIETSQSIIDSLVESITATRKNIQAFEPKSGPEYEELVREFNALVKQYNAMARMLREMVDRYNEQVSAFNACVSK